MRLKWGATAPLEPFTSRCRVRKSVLGHYLRQLLLSTISKMSFNTCEIWEMGLWGGGRARVCVCVWGGCGGGGVGGTFPDMLERCCPAISTLKCWPAFQSHQKGSSRRTCPSQAQTNTAQRHTALTPHQSHDRWPLLLLEMDTCTIIYLIKNSCGGGSLEGLMAPATCAFSKREGKRPNFHHQVPSGKNP